MAFDLNKIKQQLTNNKIFVRKQPNPVGVDTSTNKTNTPVPTNQSAMGKMMANMKHGLDDIKRVIDEGNYKLFVKQLIVLLLVFLGVRYFNDKLTQQQNNYKDQISAISIQQTHEQDYLDNKARLIRLEPAFPDMANKNEWLLRKIMDVLEGHRIQANISGNIVESSTENYTVTAQPVTFQQEFFALGKFLEDIENGDDFLRISELSIAKVTDTALLGTNNVTMKFNTLFPKEKYGPRLFKDYAKQMQELKASQTPAASDGATEKQSPAAKEDESHAK